MAAQDRNHRQDLHPRDHRQHRFRGVDAPDLRLSVAGEYVETDYLNPQSTDEMDFHVRGGNTELVNAIVARLAPGAFISIRRSSVIAQSSGG